jgi:hypothetical protein
MKMTAFLTALYHLRMVSRIAIERAVTNKDEAACKVSLWIEVVSVAGRRLAVDQTQKRTGALE